ncbi:MAG: SRPBCC family protein [Acidimicrobiia bacterium]|nr:SRPBCC family protein [Acidimicrobiia bacterium]
MSRVSKSVFIPKPASEVFDYLADFSNTAEWDPGVAEATRIDQGPVGPGSTFDLVTLFRGRRVPVTYEMTVYEPSTRVVLVGNNPRFTGTDDIGVTPEGDGTRVAWNAEFQMKGAARLLQPFLGGVFEKLSVEAMEGLEATLG